jgi:putative transposase
VIIQRAYKIEINPNNKQRTLFEKSCNVARFVYNWGLEQRINLYENEKKQLSEFEQVNILNSIKKKEFPWMYEVSSLILTSSLKDVDAAFKNFFRGLKQGKKVGFPKFKSKGKCNESFRISGFEHIKNIHKEYIQIPRVGRVRMKEQNYIPLENVHYNSMTISKHANRWFASVQCEIDIFDPKIPETVLGIDVGIKTLATCSNGDIYQNNKYMKKSQKRLAHAQRNLSRKQIGSNNRKKAVKKVQQIHYKISCQKQDSLHKMTTMIAITKPRFIVLEDLNVSGMLKNHKLAGAISDASFYEIRRMLEYKTSWYGGEVIDVDRFFPSSKLCSVCGVIKDNLTLVDRIYQCECGNEIDRDLNAAINLEHYGLNTLGSRGIQACGESVRPNECCLVQEAVSLKQEENNELVSHISFSEQKNRRLI